MGEPFSKYGCALGQDSRFGQNRSEAGTGLAHRRRWNRQGLLLLFHSTLILLSASVYAAVLLTQTPEFMSLESAKPVLEKMSAGGPARPGPSVSSKDWQAWLQKNDAEIRQRLDAGEEDTLTNLLRFGVTFTKEYRIDDEYLVHYGQSSLVNSFAENRANDLIKALAAPNGNQGLIEMRAFVEKKSFSLNSPAGRKQLKAYLLTNLARMRKEYLQAQEEAKVNRDQMFQNRGISLDTNLWPDYDLDEQLKRMLDKGMLRPGGIRRVAVVGPGLDFANKQAGLDFYPPQTVQPFAVLDSLFRLGLANPENVELYTLDISSRVNLHIEAARKNAALGRPYTVQLPWYADGRWTDEFRGKFIQYWRSLGAKIGEPVAPIPVPEAAPGFETRAVKIRPAVVSRIKPIDMNIVFQRLNLPPDERFDLIIGTNIFLYYGGFEQSLARVNVAAMLKPDGYLLSNDKLQDTVPSGLEQVMVTEIPMTGPPVITDKIYCYRRAP